MIIFTNYKDYVNIMPKTRRRQSSRSSQKPKRYSKKYSKITKRNTNKSKYSKLRNKSRKLKRNGGTKTNTTNSYTGHRSEPYSKKDTLEQLLLKLDSLLKHCKELEASFKSLSGKQICKYHHNCTRANPQHFQQFLHPNSILAAPFKRCVDEFIRISHELYIGNNQSFPTKWYSAILKIKETDYKKFDTFYFNILANLCLHSAEYTTKYVDKLFWERLLFTGFEEQAITGMYNITKFPALKKSLEDINYKNIDLRCNAEEPNSVCLSNTALLNSKPYDR